MIWEGRLHPRLSEKYHFYFGKGQGGSWIGVKGSSSPLPHNSSSQFKNASQCLSRIYWLPHNGGYVNSKSYVQSRQIRLH